MVWSQLAVLRTIMTVFKTVLSYYIIESNFYFTSILKVVVNCYLCPICAVSDGISFRNWFTNNSINSMRQPLTTDWLREYNNNNIQLHADVVVTATSIVASGVITNAGCPVMVVKWILWLACKGRNSKYVDGCGGSMEKAWSWAYRILFCSCSEITSCLSLVWVLHIYTQVLADRY